MAWVDVLYPGNKTMKTELAELCGQTKANLEMCVTAVNKLIECIEEHLPGKKFQKLAMETSESIKYHCQRITKRINDIKEYLEQKKYEVKNLLGTELFDELMDPDTKVQKKIDIARKCVVVTKSTISISGLVLVGAIAAGAVLTGVVSVLGAIACSVVACIVLSVIVSGADVIVSYFLGKIEEENLTSTLEKYRKSASEFKTAVGIFYDKVTKVRVMIELQMKVSP